MQDRENLPQIGAQICTREFLRVLDRAQERIQAHSRVRDKSLLEKEKSSAEMWFLLKDRENEKEPQRFKEFSLNLLNSL